MAKRKPNMKDVAQLAGVSIGTVSKYINGNSSITETNRKQIQYAIETLNYTPNVAAQGLAKGRSSSLLAYIVHEDPVSTASWLYDLPIIQGISALVEENKYSLQLAMAPFHATEQIYNNILNKYMEKSVAGVFIISPWAMEDKLLINLIHQGIPFVLVGAQNKIMRTNQVIMDNYAAILQVVDRLYALGHRRVAMINGLPDQYDMDERRRGLMDGALRHGMVMKDSWQSYGDQTVESGYQRVIKLFEDHDELPTAILCGNDYIAAGVIQGIKKMGYRVPEDFSVTGFDDITLTAIIDPGLTTVSLPVLELGRYGAKMMMNLLDGSSAEPGVVVPCEVIFRDSIGPVKSTD